MTQKKPKSLLSKDLMNKKNWLLSRKSHKIKNFYTT